MQYAFIDALRGWAIVAVVITHTQLQFPYLEQPILNFARDGQHGVQLFFVVSAVTLMLSWHSRQDGAVPFFIRRLFRIVPMFWLAMVFFLLLDGLEPRFFAPAGISWWHIALTATFFHGWHPETISSVVPGGWSIAAEMTFYVLFPALVLVCTSLRRTAIVFVISLAVLAIGHQIAATIYTMREPAQPQKLLDWFQYLAFWSQLPIFIIGIGAYFAMDQVKGSPRWALMLLSAGVVVIIGALLTPAGSIVYLLLPRHVVFGLGFALLACGLSAWPSRILVNPALCFIGKVSYSAYFWHFAVLAFLKPADLSVLFLSRPAWPCFIAYSMCVTAITIGISTVTYRLIERPMIVLGRRMLVVRPPVFPDPSTVR